KRVVVSTYQSVSGAGKDGMDELFAQTKAVYTAGEIEPKKFPRRIAFNLIPHIDVFMDDGYTKEEWKMMAETKKILDPAIKLTATCVRVPVFISHSEAVTVEFANPITPDEARDILRKAPGCLVIDKREDGGYATPYEAAGEDATYISRIREDATVENGLAMWIVSDNLRKGAALNAVQIPERLHNRTLVPPKKRAACSFSRALPLAWPAVHRFELTGRPVEDRQRTVRHAEIRAVQRQLAAIDKDVHARERHQIVQAACDRLFLDPGDE